MVWVERLQALHAPDLPGDAHEIGSVEAESLHRLHPPNRSRQCHQLKEQLLAQVGAQLERCRVHSDGTLDEFIDADPPFARLVLGLEVNLRCLQ